MKTKEILAELARQMNGAVSQSMREKGQKESLNLGVSLPTIKEIALRYAPNDELAMELSTKKSREARIAALYIARPETVTDEVMELWSQSWQSEELARLSAMLLFHRSPDAATTASKWLNQKGFRQTSALYIIGKIAARVDTSVIENALSVQYLDTSAAVYCFREIYNSREEFRPRIKVIAQTLSELEWQIEQ